MSKKFREWLRKMAKAKEGDTIDLDGLPVTMKSPEECEQAEVHICMRTADMESTICPAMRGHCSRCGFEIWISLDSPAKPPKICHICAIKHSEEHTTTE